MSNSERSYEQGRADGQESLRSFRAGGFTRLPAIIQNFKELRELDELSEWTRGVLDVWEESEPDASTSR